MGEQKTILNKADISLWAKKEERDGKFYWLPLMIHLEDTMNVSRWLWLNWLSDGQREFCTNSLNPSDPDTACNLAAFLGALHDIGKATPAFQTQKGFSNSIDLNQMLLEKLERAGFTGISTLALTESRKTHHSIAGQYLLQEKFQIKSDVGSIIGGHHGKPVDDIEVVENQVAYSENYYQSDHSDSDIYKKWANVHQDIFQWAMKSAGLGSIDDIPEISQPAQVLYSGLLIMADWISSNSDYFPLIPLDSDQAGNSRDRCRNGIRTWGGNLPLQIQSFPSMNQLFKSRFGFAPRDFQKTVYSTVCQINKPGILILEAPMGLGKTEAALAVAEEIAEKTGSSGLFFGLPTQATSNSMFGRIRIWLENLLADQPEPDVRQSLRLCHGKAALNEEMNRLRDASAPQDINIDDEKNGNVHVNEWFTGRKKTSLDDFVVGTVDGFLLTALKQKHLALRHLGFSKKVIIIDEVHAYDTYMQQYLEEAIRWMGAYNTPVILLSATLPQDKRKKLFSAYLKGRGVKQKEIQFPKELSETRYPLLSFSEGREVKAQADFLPAVDKRIQIRRLKEEELLEKIGEQLDGGGVIGIIVNTVRRAQKLGKACKERFGENTVVVLHSAFLATDRVDKESLMMNMIGKNGKRPEKKIIIGTQVIEQSLDIDFDVLITDLCPIDLLLQRIGRLHRHEIMRPENHKNPVVYIMGISNRLEFEKGAERIYGSYFLIRTQFYLPEEIRIPSDIPVLIDKVYSGGDLELPEKLLEIYQESREKMEVLREKKAYSAQTYRLQDPHSKIKPEKYNLIEWLKNPEYSDSDEAAAAQVRDIQETIEVIAIKKTGSGYGTFKKAEDISSRIGEPYIARELAKQTIRLPNYVTMKKGVSQTIDELENYNKKYLADWQEQPWLKGTLGIIFDEEGHFKLNGMTLTYDREFGLREENEYGKV